MDWSPIVFKILFRLFHFLPALNLLRLIGENDSQKVKFSCIAFPSKYINMLLDCKVPRYRDSVRQSCFPEWLTTKSLSPFNETASCSR